MMENVIYGNIFKSTSDPSKLYGAPKETCKEISAGGQIHFRAVSRIDQKVDAVSDRRALNDI